MAPLAPAIERALDRLERPLVVAVTGHVSAGKSTLVNALAGRDVAATGAAETTLVNWWLRRGMTERVIVRRRGAEPVELAVGEQPELRDGELDADAREPITAWLDSPLLEGLVLVDTPGLFSAAEDERSARARELVRAQTVDAAGGADAIIYVSAEAPGAARDVAELDAFSAGFPDLGHAPTNAIVVLTKADRFWPGADDPLEVAARTLDGARETWRSRAWQALPVAALLARPRLEPEVLDGVRELADAPDLTAAVRLGAARARSGGASPAQASALHALGPFGCWTAARAMASGDDVAGALLRASGVDSVRETVDRMFRSRALTMRTDRLLRELEQVALLSSTEPAEAARLHEVIDEIRAGPHGAGLRKLTALRLAADPRVRLAPEAREQARALFSGATPAERLAADPSSPSAALHAEARLRARWWRELEAMRPSAPDRRWLAAQAASEFEALAHELDSVGGR